MPKQFEYIYTENNQFEQKELDPSSLVIGNNDVLVKPHFVGICGSDLFLIHSGLKNLRLGHEWVGEVLDIGKNVTRVKIGSIVTGTGHFSCGECAYCLQEKTNLCDNSLHFSSDKMGALRTSFIAPQDQIFTINSPLDSALALLEIFAVGEQAHHLIKEILIQKLPNNILIFGAGPIGLATAAVFRSYNLDFTIIEKVNSRLKKAKALDFNVLSLQEAFLDTTFKNKFNLLIDCSNDYSGDQGAFRWLNYFSKKEYTALVVGKYVKSQTLSGDFNSKSAKLIWMRGVSSNILKKTIAKWQAELVSMKPYFISHEFNIENLANAFKKAENKIESFKVIIKIN